MASEASVAEHTTDGHVEEKKVVDDVKNVDGESTSQSKEIGGDDVVEKLKVEESVSFETAITESEEKTADKKDGKPPVDELTKGDGVDETSSSEVPENKKDDGLAVEEVNKEEENRTSASGLEVLEYKKVDAPTAQDVKEEEVNKASGSEVLEEKKNYAPVVEEMEREVEDGISEHKKVDAPAAQDVKEEANKASDSELLEEKENDAPAVEVVKREVEDGKTPSSREPANEFDKKGPEENIVNSPEASTGVVEKPVEELEVSPIQDSEQVRKELGVSEPVAEIAKSLEEPVDISADSTSVSERVSIPDEQLAVPVSTQLSSDVTVEVNNQSEMCEVGKSADTSKDEKILIEEPETSPELKKKEADLRETVLLDADSENSEKLEGEVKDAEAGAAVSDLTEKAEAGTTTIGSMKQSIEEESVSDAVEGLVKDVTADANVLDPSAIIGVMETIDTASVTELAENIVKPEVKVKEEKQEKTVKSDEQAPTDTDKTQDLSCSDSATEINETSSEKEKPSDGVEKVVEEQKNLTGSTSSDEVTKISSDEGDASEVVEEQKDESVKDDMTAVVETSRDLDLGGRTDETTSVKEPVGKSEETKLEVRPEETVQTAEKLEKGEGEEKNDETERPDAQTSVESFKDGVVLKTDVGVPKAEAPAKPSQRRSNNIISKVKHSIGKVKKAIIGKSPSSKTMSSEAKDESTTK